MENLIPIIVRFYRHYNNVVNSGTRDFAICYYFIAANPLLICRNGSRYPEMIYDIDF